jgi:hypothetical protein
MHEPEQVSKNAFNFLLQKQFPLRITPDKCKFRQSVKFPPGCKPGNMFQYPDRAYCTSLYYRSLINGIKPQGKPWTLFPTQGSGN